MKIKIKKWTLLGKWVIGYAFDFTQNPLFFMDFLFFKIISTQPPAHFFGIFWMNLSDFLGGSNPCTAQHN